MSHELPAPESTVLSTLNEDGTRRWLHPRPSPGRFLTRRRILAYLLIAVFTLLPYLRINGKPSILLDIPAREFTLFGFTFLPTDTLLLALFVLGSVIGVFLVTAMFGRVWCGWVCPQTVYLEFVYRPIERLFEGPPGRRHAAGKKSTGMRRAAKYVAYLLISMFLAHTFLAYFVGVGDLLQWIRRSPIEHPTGFVVMLLTTGAMMFDFCFFREQACIVACPYGRFQSVLLDRDSLIVSYDTRRGEPRKKGRRDQGDGPPAGDCIDCGSCVDTCPTGIDIRNGLQLECVACTQCIDACDAIMQRIKKPRGLIRFSSQSRMAGEIGRFWRPRVVLYPAIMAVLLTAFLIVILGKESADITLLRGFGQPFTEITAGQITNQVRVKIKNRTADNARYSIELADASVGQLEATRNPLEVAGGESQMEVVLVTVPRNAFQSGKCPVLLRISDGEQFSKEVEFKLLGPDN